MKPKYYFVKQPVGGKATWLHMQFETEKAAMNMLPRIVKDEPDDMQIALVKLCNQFVVVDGKAIEEDEEE